jgi:hypothetical protein
VNNARTGVMPAEDLDLQSLRIGLAHLLFDRGESIGRT